MTEPAPDLIVRLAETWYGLKLEAADAEGLAAALAPVEATMRAAEGRIGFEDMNLARVAASLARLAPDSAHD